MKRIRALHVLKILLIVLLAVAIVGFAVKVLWNALMPQIFGWHAITYWQALGLLVLCKLLFAGFRGPGGRWRARLQERWAEMTPAERERFRQGLRGRCRPTANPVESSE